MSACLFGGWMVPVNPSSCCPSSGLLLLMIGVIATLLPQLWARPTDFWCNCQARKSMERRIERMQTDVVRNRNGQTKKIPLARSQNVIAVGKTCACDKHFLYVVRCTAWVLTHCPLLHSSRVFGCTQRNGQIKLWVTLMQNLQTFENCESSIVCFLYTYACCHGLFKINKSNSKIH